MNESLHDLVQRHAAMKPAGYLPMYEALLGSLRGLPLSILEIGICTGASLRVWADYCPRASVCGVDLVIPEGAFPERVRMFQGDQGDAGFLERVALQAGPFDLIVDDGSHRPDDWSASFRCLWPKLKRGGHYVIEDLMAPYHAHAGWTPDQIEALRVRLTEIAQPMLRQVEGTDIEYMQLRPHLLVAKKWSGS